MPDRLGLGRLPAPLRRRRARPVVARVARLFAGLDRRLLGAGRPTIGGWIAGGVPVMLPTTTGRRSSAPHTRPVLFHRAADGSLLVVAANGTADWQPDWYLNLRANPAVQVEIDRTCHDALAEVLEGDERSSAWNDAQRAFPGLEAAQHATKRPIPLVRLTIMPAAGRVEATGH